MEENTGKKTAERYRSFYDSVLGREVLSWEANAIRDWLGKCSRILDVGCGPGAFEGELSDLDIVGVDKDAEMVAVGRREEKGTFVVADAESLPFHNGSFDGLFFVSSLAFIDDVKKTVAEAKQVLSAGARVIALLCNPQSAYFTEKRADGEYTSTHLKHRNLKGLVAGLSEAFNITGDYQLGINDSQTFESHDRETASLYVLRGVAR